MRTTFDREIMNLLNDVNVMGTRVDRIIGNTYTAVKEKDFVLSKKIFEEDYKINNMEIAIEQSAISLIALQQPVASDLRRITAALKLVTDIERIADQCADICEIMNSNPTFHQAETPQSVMLMLEKSRTMFVQALESFMQLDVDMAEDVMASDDAVDELYSRVVLEMTKKIEEATKLKAHAVDYILISKFAERIGDHATNIAEWTIYAVTGNHSSMEMNGGNYNDTDNDENEE